MEKPEKLPITRKCACGCRRTFTVAYAHVQKVYFDRHCANNHTKRPKPVHRAGARRKSGVPLRARSEFILCEIP